MYKVFIDHKPIVFINPSEVVNDFESVDASEIYSILEGIQPFLESISLDAPLQIVCQDCEKDFLRLFESFDFIEAAGGVVRSDKGYLMIFRNGLWDIPKGKLAKNESVETAAVREVEEECAITAPLIESPLIDTYHTYVYKGKNVLKKTYWFVMSYSGNESLVPQINEGITKVKWVSKAELLDIRGNTYGSINEVIDAYQSQFFLEE